MKNFLMILVMLLTLCGMGMADTLNVTPVNIPGTNTNDTITPSQKRVLIGSDGFPRMVYMDENVSPGFATLKYLKCNDALCASITSNTVYQTNLNTHISTGCILVGGTAPTYSFTLDSTDHPYIALEGNNTSCGGAKGKAVGLVTCSDTACASPTFTLADTMDVELPVSIAVDSTHTSSILFQTTPTAGVTVGLSISTCTSTPSCSAGVAAISAIANTNILNISTLHVNPADNTLIFAYFVGPNSTAGAIHYWNNATDTNAVSTTRSMSLDMDIGADGFGNIVWAQRNAGTQIQFAHCTNSLCSSISSTKALSVTFNFGRNPSISMNATDGFARIAYPTFTTGGGPPYYGWTYIVCQDAGCVSNASHNLTPPSGLLDAQDVSIAATTGGGAYFIGQSLTSAGVCNSPNCQGIIVPVNISNPDFTITATPSVQVLKSAIGAQATYTVTIAPLAGFTGNVALTSSGAPSGANVQFNPTPVTGGSGTSVATVTLGVNTTSAVYPIVLTGTSGALVHSVTVSLTVLRQQPRFVSRTPVALISDTPGVSIPVRSKDGKIQFSYNLVETPVAFTFQGQWVINAQMIGVSSPALVYYGPIYPAAPLPGAPANVAIPAYIQSITDSSVVKPSAVTAATPVGAQGWFFIDSSYVSHLFDVTGTSGAVIINDGTGYTLSASGSKSVICQTTPCPTITDVGGNVVANNNNIDPLYRGNVGSFTDPNGNMLTAFAVGDAAQTVIYTDSMGLVVLTAAETHATSVPPNDPTPTNQYTYTSSGGGTRRFIVNYGQFYQSTNFGCPGITEMPHTPAYLPVSVSLPDGTAYSITYEPTPGIAGDVTGRIAAVVSPSGGLTRYQYSGGSNGVNCTDGSVPTMTVTTPDGGTWTYVHTLN